MGKKAGGAGIAMKWVFIALYIIFTVSGLVLFKFGAGKGTSFLFHNGVMDLKLNVISLLGIVLYCCSFLLYLSLISQMDLGYIYPVTTGIVYVFVLLASAFIFRETFSAVQLSGCILIVVGVVLMNLHR